MKLKDIKKISDNLTEGYRFQVYSGTDIYATVVPIDQNKKENIKSMLLLEYTKNNPDKEYKYVSDIPIEERENIDAYSTILSSIINIEGIEDDEGNSLEWNFDLAKKLVENGNMKLFQTIFDYISNLTIKGTAFEIDEDTKKKQ